MYTTFAASVHAADLTARDRACDSCRYLKIKARRNALVLERN